MDAELYFTNQPGLVRWVDFADRLGKSVFTEIQRELIYQRIIAPSVDQLVGWNATDGAEILQASTAYDATHRLLRALAQL